jgi:uncharacterized protein (TIGR03067 family)
MGIQALVMMAASLVGVVDRPLAKKDSTRQETKQLQGTWRVIMLETHGRQFPEERLRQLNYQLVIRSQDFIMMVRGRARTMRFKIDPKARPKTMDLVAVDGPIQGRTTQAIYLLDGDTLKICQSLPG